MQPASPVSASAPALSPPITDRVSETTAFDAGRAIHHGRFAVADALRLLAIVAVVFNHLALETRPLFFGHEHQFNYVGRWGVATFFVLSGYLLSSPYLRSVINNAPWPSTKRYLVRRVLRIFPLYLVALAFSVAVVYVLGQHPTVFDILTHVLMLQDFSVLTVPTINPPLWTMPVDFEFYLCLPLLAFGSAMLLRFRKDRRARAIVVLLGIGTVLTMIYRFSVTNALGAQVDGPGQYVFVDNGVRMAGAFFIGIFLALLFGFRRPSTSRTSRWLLVLAALTLIAVYVRIDASGALISAVEPVIAALSAALLLYALPQFRTVVRVAETRAIALGATLAYGIYLFHFPTIEVLSAALRLPAGNRSFLILAGLTLAVVVPVAYVAHRFVERPFLLIKDRQR